MCPTSVLIFGPATVGQYLDLTDTCFLKNLKFEEKLCVISNMIKMDLHISASQVQKWQNYLELRAWSHETESVSDSVRGRLRLKCDGTRAETRFRLSAKRRSPFKSAGASVQFTTGSRGLRISGGSAGYTMVRGSVKSTGYPLHSPVSPSLPLPYVTVCHHISTGLYTSDRI
jgi:hypothetical protein